MKFEELVKEYNNILEKNNMGFRLDLECKNQFRIVLANNNGLKSYIINLTSEERKNMENFFAEYDITLISNKTGSMYWESR